MKIYKNLFDEIVSTETLFSAWDKFKNGKRNKKDVQRTQNSKRTHKPLHNLDLIFSNLLHFVAVHHLLVKENHF